MGPSRDYIEKQEEKLCFTVDDEKYKVVGIQSEPYMVLVKNVASGKSKLMNPKKINKYLPIIWDGKYDYWK